MRRWGALVVGGVVAAGLVGVATEAGAAPALAPITRVGPTTLGDARVLDLSPDGRWVLVSTNTLGQVGVQRIDRNGNTATNPLPITDDAVAMTDDGTIAVQASVSSTGDVTVTRTALGSGAQSIVIAGNLGTGTWSMVGGVSISGDGRFVVLSASDAFSGKQVIEVVDTRAPASISQVDVGLPAANVRQSSQPSISVDGRYVAFATSGLTSSSTNCVAGPDCGDIWVRDLVAHTSKLVSVTKSGAASDGTAWAPRLSSTGRFVVFIADADDIVPTATRDLHVYVRDLQGGVTALVPGAPKSAVPARAPSISDDGRLVAFESVGQRDDTGTSTTVPDDEVLLADLSDSSVVQVARQSTGAMTTGQSLTPFLRADGTEVIFTSSDPAILATPPTSTWNVYADRIGGPESAGATTLPRSKFVPLAPARVLDTRTGIGVAAGKPAAGSTTVVRVAGVGAVPNPTTTVAVVLNVTATEAGGPGYVTVYPDGSPRPTTSNLNIIRAGQTIPNLVVVPVGPSGAVDLFTFGSTHLLADVLGYFSRANTSPDGRFVAQSPARVLDTRVGLGAPKAKRPAGSVLKLQIAGQAGVPATGASAVVLNVTATADDKPGYVTVFPGGTPPNASNLNLDHVNQTIPNMVMVPLAPDGSVSLYTFSRTDLIADVEGYFTDASSAVSAAGMFVATQPVRMDDTRIPFARPAAEGAVTRVPVNLPPLPATGVAAAMLNVTAVEASAPGYVTVYPAGAPLPYASNLNIEQPGQTISNAAIATLGGGAFNAYTFSGTHLVVDLFGYFRT